MTLEEIGYNKQIEKNISKQDLKGFIFGRVIAEHKERYTVLTQNGEYNAEITGNLRFTAQKRNDFPAVGDWVALLTFDNNFAVIHKIVQRYSIIKRRTVGSSSENQIIATNIDFAFIVQAADRDFNINRIERYLTLCNSGNVEPIVILSKSDLITHENINSLLIEFKKRIGNVQVFPISNKTLDGYIELKKIILKGKTYCMLGSSGVGKSSLINNLAGKVIMKTNNVSLSVNKGKHTTSYRELIIMDNGGIFIDNPGMREVGVTDVEDGLKTTFQDITSLSKYCKFKDCKHISEIGCAVISGVESGEIDRKSYENYIKLEKEKTYFETSALEKRKKDKDFGKMIKNFKKSTNNYK